MWVQTFVATSVGTWKLEGIFVATLHSAAIETLLSRLHAHDSGAGGQTQASAQRKMWHDTKIDDSSKHTDRHITVMFMQL